MKVDVAVAEWAERFPRAAASTTANNTSQAKHFAEMFPNRELGSVTAAEFERFAQVHPGAARYARTLLNDYRDAGVLEENVSDGVRIPRVPKKKVVVPTVEEVEKLCTAARGLAKLLRSFPEHMEEMIQVAAYTGLREGELRALAVADIRERTKREVIEAEVEFSIDRRERLKAPKTRSSQDTFTFLGDTPRAVAQLIDGYYADRGHPRIPRDKRTDLREGRLFPYTRAKRQAAWEKVRYKAGVGVTWHSLRHFCATWLLDNDAAIDDVALQLRCSVEEVRATYGHPNRKAALARLREVGR